MAVLTDADKAHLRRCVALAREALDAGDEPFGSVLVDADGAVLGHGWVGLGRIVYASSSAQLVQWLSEAGAPAPPVLPLPVQQVAPGVVVQGPVDDLAEEVRALQMAAHARS